jgi:hypothetical protein
MISANLIRLQMAYIVQPGQHSLAVKQIDCRHGARLDIKQHVIAGAQTKKMAD